MAAPSDDLHLALCAVRGQELPSLALVNGVSLTRASSSAGSGGGGAPAPAPAAEALAAAGCRRLLELVHNQPAHKLEAVDRGALPALVALISAHAAASPDLASAAMRAVRAIAFKCEPARARAVPDGVLAAMLAALGVALDSLAPEAGGLPAGGGGSDGGNGGTAAASLAEEALVCLAALVSRSLENGVAVVGAGGRAAVTRALAVAAGGGAPLAAVAQKATMLQLLLGEEDA